MDSEDEEEEDGVDDEVFAQKMHQQLNSSRPRRAAAMQATAQMMVTPSFPYPLTQIKICPCTSVELCPLCICVLCPFMPSHADIVNMYQAVLKGSRHQALKTLVISLAFKKRRLGARS